MFDKSSCIIYGSYNILSHCIDTFDCCINIVVLTLNGASMARTRCRWRRRHSSDLHHRYRRRRSVFVPTVRAVRMPRAFIHRRTRAASPAIPVATAAAVFANWLRRRRRWRASTRGGEGLGRARVPSSRGVRRPRRVQSVYTYHRRPYDTTAASVVRPNNRPIASLSIPYNINSINLLLLVFYSPFSCV